MCDLCEKDIEDSFVSIYDACYGMLEKACLRMIGYNPVNRDLVDDCIQETFLLFAMQFDVLHDHPNIRGWLLTTARNRILTAISKVKRRNVHHAFSIDAQPYDTLSEGKDTIEIWVRTESLLDMFAHLEHTLSQQEKTVYRSYFVLQQTINATANLLNITNGAVKACVARIRKKAKKISTEYSFFL